MNIQQKEDSRLLSQANSVFLESTCEQPAKSRKIRRRPAPRTTSERKENPQLETSPNFKNLPTCKRRDQKKRIVACEFKILSTWASLCSISHRSFSEASCFGRRAGDLLLETGVFEDGEEGTNRHGDEALNR
ncbi:hypothetical protein BT93_A0864 [Corymbia citriodora subsp. variegata]|nr:hypothetical protein BT93_A0864 [Corymbia citriodora subsp. variegata]